MVIKAIQSPVFSYISTSQKRLFHSIYFLRFFIAFIWYIVLGWAIFYRKSPGLLHGMTGPPNFAVSPSTLTAILYWRRLPVYSDAMKLKRIFQGPMKTRPFSAGVNLWSFWTITLKNGGICVRVLRCHQGRVRPSRTEMFYLSSFQTTPM